MKQSTIALYLLIIINLIGLSIIVKNTADAFNPKDYSKEVAIVDSQLSRFDTDPYLNLKILNQAKVPVDHINVHVSVFDTNNVHVCTFDETFYSTFHPNEERLISFRLGYTRLKHLEDNYTFKPSIGSAHGAR